MIGNTIKFRYYPTGAHGFRDYNKAEEEEGVVVDAFTEITGSVKGESIFGFGEVSGDTKCRRMYKVQYTVYNSQYFTTIHDSQLISIVRFAHEVVLGEKFKVSQS
jgi:hypothetical protein